MASDTAVPFDEKTILGHPRALFVLFFAELWERFCYYGMRALLALHIAKEFFGHMQPEAAQEAASASYGGFTALVYALAIFGGAVADRVLGYRRSIIMGGLIMAGGEFLLMSGDRTVFFFGLALLIVGNGLFKPNISTLVGKLYKQGDPRRDGGFTIFYMGINIGATLAPLACEAVSTYMGSYRYGFMLAGIGMLLGLVFFGIGGKTLGDRGLPPAGKTGMGPILQVLLGCALVAPAVYGLLSIKEDYVGYILYAAFGVILLYLISIAAKEETIIRQRMFVLILMLLFNVVFWMGFEQAGNSLNFFAKKQLVPLEVGGWSMPAEWWQSVNAIFIVALGPLFAAMWVALDKVGRNPSIPRKFGFGLIGMGLGFLVINSGISGASSAGMVMWYFLLGLYFIHTCGELCLSPVGLSMVTKLAPERMTGMVMGSWFISIATGNFLAGELSSHAAGKAKVATDALAKVHAYGDAFTYMIYVGIGAGALLFLASPVINKWMHGVK